MEANCALVIAAGVQALATIVLVFVTRWYATKTSEMAEATKENVGASKAIAEATVKMAKASEINAIASMKYAGIEENKQIREREKDKILEKLRNREVFSDWYSQLFAIANQFKITPGQVLSLLRELAADGKVIQYDVNGIYELPLPPDPN